VRALRRYGPGLAAIPAAAVVGLAVTSSLNLALVLTAIPVALLLLRLGTWSWVAAALATVLFTRPLTAAGALPATVNFADFPLAAGALAAALIRRRGWGRAGWLGLWVIGLAAAVALSALVTSGSTLKAVLEFLLYGEPWLIVLALVADPPSPRAWRWLAGLLLGGALLQVPVALVQWRLYGSSDPVQGTFIGNAAAAHLLGGYLALIALVALSRSLTGRASHNWTLLGLGLLIIPVVADAKQVLFAFPFAFLPLVRRVSPARLAGVAGILLVGAFAVAQMGPTKVAVRIIEASGSGHSQKLETVELIREELLRGPLRFSLGIGPGTTVSRVALLASGGLVKDDSPIASLGLELSPITTRIILDPRWNLSTASSFQSAMSSTIGLIGDLGLAGTLAYGGLLVVLWRRLGRTGSANAAGARGALVLLAVLGVVANWWEQPAFTIPLAVVAGLTLTDPAARPEQEAP
jgi:hypothetical protein